MLFYSYFRHCNSSQYLNVSMSNLCNNYDVKMTLSKVLFDLIYRTTIEFSLEDTV